MPSQDYEYELPKTAEPTVYANSAGFVHEISAVQSGILQGKSLMFASDMVTFTHQPCIHCSPLRMAL